MMHEDMRMNTYCDMRRKFVFYRFNKIGRWSCKSNKYKNKENNTFEEIWNNDKQYLLWMINNNKFKNKDIIFLINKKKDKDKLIEKFPKYPIELYHGCGVPWDEA